VTVSLASFGPTCLGWLCATAVPRFELLLFPAACGGGRDYRSALAVRLCCRAPTVELATSCAVTS